MTNLARLHKMKSAELAELLSEMAASEALPYMDWASWLASDVPELIPDGTIVLADILAKTRDGRCITRTTVPCVILDDKVRRLGTRYCRIYDLTDNKVKLIPSDRLEVVIYE